MCVVELLSETDQIAVSPINETAAEHTAQMGDVVPNQTIYVHNLHEKIKKDGEWTALQTQVWL